MRIKPRSCDQFRKNDASALSATLQFDAVHLQVMNKQVKKEDPKKRSLLSWFVKANNSFEKVDENEVVKISDDEQLIATENSISTETRSVTEDNDLNVSTSRYLLPSSLKGNDSPMDVQSEVIFESSESVKISDEIADKDSDKLHDKISAKLSPTSLCNVPSVPDCELTTSSYEKEVILAKAVKQRGEKSNSVKSKLLMRHQSRDKKERADAVVKHLTFHYKKGRIESKELFKEFARKLTHLLTEDKNVTCKNGECLVSPWYWYLT